MANYYQPTHPNIIHIEKFLQFKEWEKLISELQLLSICLRLILNIHLSKDKCILNDKIYEVYKTFASRYVCIKSDDEIIIPYKELQPYELYNSIQIESFVYIFQSNSFLINENYEIIENNNTSEIRDIVVNYNGDILIPVGETFPLQQGNNLISLILNIEKLNYGKIYIYNSYQNVENDEPLYIIEHDENICKKISINSDTNLTYKIYMERLLDKNGRNTSSYINFNIIAEIQSLPSTISKDMTLNYDEAFKLIWDILQCDKYNLLKIDATHLNVKIYEMDRLINNITYKSSDKELLFDKKYINNIIKRTNILINQSNLSLSDSESVKKMINTILNNDVIYLGPSTKEERIIKYKPMIKNLNEIFEKLETTKKDMIDFVFSIFAEGSQLCIFRWEQDIREMHKLLVETVQDQHNDDIHIIIYNLLESERSLHMESILHRIRGEGNISDIHFNNYILTLSKYGTVHEYYAIQDPYINNYIDTLDESFQDYIITILLNLYENYTPNFIAKFIIKNIFNSTESTAVIIKDKIYNWLRANIPQGFMSHKSLEERREKWLYEYCHDDNYEIRIEAIYYMLIRMSIIKLDYSDILNLKISNF